MNLRFTALLTGLSLLMVPGSAHAQFSVQDRQASEADARRVADDFGACMTGSFRAVARRIVLEPVPHEHAFDEFRTEISGQCLNESDVSGPPSQLSFPYPTLHAVLADNLVKREFRDAGPADLTSAPTIFPIAPPQSPGAEDLAEMSERQRLAASQAAASNDAWLVLQRIGLCTARRSPEASRQSLQTRIGSDEERVAMQALGTEIGGCIPAGSTVRLRRAELRWALALGYYRLAMAAPQTSTTDAEATQ